MLQSGELKRQSNAIRTEPMSSDMLANSLKRTDLSQLDFGRFLQATSHIFEDIADRALQFAMFVLHARRRGRADSLHKIADL